VPSRASILAVYAVAQSSDSTEKIGQSESSAS